VSSGLSELCARPAPTSVSLGLFDARDVVGRKPCAILRRAPLMFIARCSYLFFRQALTITVEFVAEAQIVLEAVFFSVRSEPSHA